MAAGETNTFLDRIYKNGEHKKTWIDVDHNSITVVAHDKHGKQVLEYIKQALNEKYGHTAAKFEKSKDSLLGKEHKLTVAFPLPDYPPHQKIISPYDHRITNPQIVPHVKAEWIKAQTALRDEVGSLIETAESKLVKDNNKIPSSLTR